jgi:hypothetical protein
MSTDGMKERITETSPQVYARIGGVLYLIIIVIGFSSEFFVRDKLVVSGDVTATASNILASESLWRITIAGELILLVLCCRADHDLLCIAQAGEQKSCFAGGIAQHRGIPY